MKTGTLRSIPSLCGYENVIFVSLHSDTDINTLVQDGRGVVAGL